jgi:hypothetical protein
MRSNQGFYKRPNEHFRGCRHAKHQKTTDGRSRNFSHVAAADMAAAVKVGQTAPDFSVESIDSGSTIRLSDFRGRRVLLITWASW